MHSVNGLSISRMIPDRVVLETVHLAFLPPRRKGGIVASSSLASSLARAKCPNIYDEEATVSIMTGFLLCCIILMDVPSP